LLPIGDRDERSELDDLRVGEMLPEHRPDTIVGALGVPYEHARVKERRLSTPVEMVGALEVQKVLVISLGEPLLSAPERPL
jgi:hypothetical protein